MNETDILNFFDYMDALDTMQGAIIYLVKQYSKDMPLVEARAHFDARLILVRKHGEVLAEAEAKFLTPTDAARRPA